MELTMVAAFLGGVLALLSPCGALLLPAFFAATLTARGRILLHGGLFFLGLLVTLVPLGLGASFLGSLMTTHRDVLIAVAGWFIIVFGLLQVVGLGFDVSKALPGVGRLSSAAPRVGAAGRSVLLGTVSGVAGFCSGPILGAVLTMAATEPSQVLAGTMLAVYGAGMVVPLVALASVWTRLGERGRARLRGRAWQLGPVQLHSTSVITGVLLIAVGIVFLQTNGMATLPQLVPAGTLAGVQSAIMSFGAAVPEAVLIVAGAVIALGVWWRGRRRQGEVARPGEPVAPAAGRWPTALGLVSATGETRPRTTASRGAAGEDRPRTSVTGGAVSPGGEDPTEGGLR